MAAEPAIAAREVSKRFTGTQALDGVSFDVRAGEVHALVGENGAGKSTLIKLLGGVHAPDAGAIRVGDQPRRFRDPAEALAAGIVVIPQEIRVVPALSVAENVLLGQIPTRRVVGLLPAVDRRALRRRAAEPLARLNLVLDPDLRVDALGHAERQLVMIARALAHAAKVLILDEPTASLEGREVERLFEVVRGLKRQGVGIVFVSHRLDEVIALADRCTVLRDGRVVAVLPREALDLERLIQLMTGRDLAELRHPHDRVPGAALLEWRHPAAEAALERAMLREREVVGLAGLLGSGTTELLKGLFGAGAARGEVRLKGKRMTASAPADAIAQGIGFVPGDRAQALVPGLTVRENIALPNLDRLAGRWRLDAARIDRLVRRLMDELDIRPRDPGRPLRELSGGNQQKVVFARWLAGQAAVLLLDEPTHGIDIGAKTHIHRLMREFAGRGGGILVSSSEASEILAISDSVIAMRQGRLVARLSRGGDYTEGALRKELGG
jgi:ABC-type sugar transport system ATPase subunit